jgi:hypothetical protein
VREGHATPRRTPWREGGARGGVGWGWVGACMGRAHPVEEQREQSDEACGGAAVKLLQHDAQLLGAQPLLELLEREVLHKLGLR